MTGRRTFAASIAALGALMLAAAMAAAPAQARQLQAPGSATGAASLPASAPAPGPASAAAAAIPANSPTTAGAAATLPATASQTAAAQPASPPAVVAAPVRPFAGAAAGSLLQTIFALCVVLGLLALLAWALKRYGPRAAGGSAHVRLVGGLNLGGRERIVVVEVGDQWIVVGASPGRVNALATMARQDGDRAGGALPGDAALLSKPSAAPSFSAWLRQTIDKRNAS